MRLRDGYEWERAAKIKVKADQRRPRAILDATIPTRTPYGDMVIDQPLSGSLQEDSLASAVAIIDEVVDSIRYNRRPGQDIDAVVAAHRTRPIDV
jgi:hypothetical protein